MTWHRPERQAELWNLEHETRITTTGEAFKESLDLEASRDILRVVRGGAFYGSPGFVRAAFRYWLPSAQPLRPPRRSGGGVPISGVDLWPLTL